MGRERDPMLAVRVPEAEQEAWRKFCAEREMSLSEWVRTMLRWCYQKRYDGPQRLG